MHAGDAHDFGAWCWHERHVAPCRVVDAQELWGEVAYRVWLPDRDAIVRAHAADLASLDSVQPKVEHILHAAAAAKLLDALEEDLLLAPIQSSVVPLPHQLYALNRAMSRDRIRYLLADEVGLGKTIEAGLILRELKFRGMARRILVVTPKGLVRQWQAEMQLHFGEHFQFIEPAELSAFRQWRNDKENLWRLHDQVICSLDSVKPLERRRGWSLEQLNTYNRERFEDLVSASWDMVIIDEAHRMGGSTDQVARYKLGVALAGAAPYLLLLSATPHQGKTDQFLRLMQLIDRDSFPDECSVTSERVRPFLVRSEKRAAINADGNPLFKPRVTRLHPVAWQDRHAAQQALYEAVTDYVRHGYNQAVAAKQRHIGFLMILMQRLVTSSTAAIRATLREAPSLARTAAVPALHLRDDRHRRMGGTRRSDPSRFSRSDAGLGDGEGGSRHAARTRPLHRGTGHGCQGRGAVGADLQDPARRERSGAEDTNLHRVRAYTVDACRVPGKPWFFRSPRSTAAWTSMPACVLSRRSHAMCALWSPQTPAAKA